MNLPHTNVFLRRLSPGGFFVPKYKGTGEINRLILGQHHNDHRVTVQWMINYDNGKIEFYEAEYPISTDLEDLQLVNATESH